MKPVSTASPPDDAPPSEWAWWTLPALSLAALVAVLVGSDRLPAADGPHMLAQCLRLAQDLHDGQLGEVISRIGTLAAPHPPVGYLPTFLFAVLGFGVEGMVILGDLVWLLLLADGLRRLCRGDHPAVAPLAFFLGMSTGLSWWAADHYGFDLVGAAVVAQVMGWLAASEGLARPWPRRAFGLWLALGFLTKYSVPLLLFVPVVAVCAPALRRRPRAVLEAVGVWALLAIPYYAMNFEAVAAYVGNTLAPPDLPGEYPQEMSFLDRFGSGQLLMATAIKDAFGLPLAAALAAGAVWQRRWLVSSGVVGGILLLGMLNEQQGRYMLPLVFLLAVAGAPRPGPWFRWHLAGLGLLGLIGLRSSLGTYAVAEAADTPSQRDMTHDTQGLLDLRDWPELPSPYQPVSAPLAEWEVDRVLDALEARHEPGDIAVVLLDGPPWQPNAAMYMMAVEERRLGIDLLTLHARLSPNGALVVNDYVGPFPRELVAKQGEAAWTGLRWAYLVASADGSGAAWTWLNHQPHVIVDQWDLPADHRGLLVELLEGP